MSWKPMMIVIILAALQLITVMSTRNLGTPNSLAVKTDELLSEKINQFSFDLFQKFNGKINLVLSPISVWTVLSMALLGTDGSTRNELLKGLQLNENTLNEVLPQIKKICQKLNAIYMVPSTYEGNEKIPRVELRLSNQIFLRTDLRVENKFTEEFKSYHNSTLQFLNFQQSIEASKIINDWVDRQTNSRIKNIIDPSAIDGSTAMILINTLYLKGSWKHQFVESLTSYKDFHLPKGNLKKVPMMNVLGNFKYGKIPELDVSFIELPYKNTDDQNAVSMLIISPANIKAFGKAERNLKNIWSNFLKTTEETNCILLLPKFKIESTINLQDSLGKLEISNIFEDSANFSRITKSPLKVSKILQKVFIEVNEKGTEAAAATEVTMTPRSIESIPIKVNVDKPFLFLICTREIILFSGKVINPVQEIPTTSELDNKPNNHKFSSTSN